MVETPVRKGQLILKTECEVCGQTMRNPTTAAKHMLRHGKQKPEQPPVSAKTPGFGPTFGGTWPVDETVVCSPSCLDRGDSWASTPCLCVCHYQGPSARRMIKAQEAENGE